MRLSTLQIPIDPAFEKNLDRLLALYRKAAGSAMVLAPEVALTGFAYERFEEAAAFSRCATDRLAEAVGETPLALTMVEREEGAYYNVAKVFHKGRVVHARKKHKLFLLGDEHRYFAAGPEEGIAPFETGGLTVGVLVCFELRFPHLWKRLEGCDLILIPAQWGRVRKAHLEKLSEALAIANRCFVAVSDGADADMARSSALITPWGEARRDDRRSLLSQEFDLREIKKMRRAIPYEE